MTRAWIRTASVLALAVLCGLAAAYATMRLMAERGAQLPEVWMVNAIDEADGGVRVTLEGGRHVRVDTVARPANARNLALLYPGKAVALTLTTDGESGERCLMVVPLLQQDRPALSVERYTRLKATGLSDIDLAVSYELPAAEDGPAAPETGAGRGVCAVTS